MLKYTTKEGRKAATVVSATDLEALLAATELQIVGRLTAVQKSPLRKARRQQTRDERAMFNDAHRCVPQEAGSRVTINTDPESDTQIVFVPTGITYGGVPGRPGPRWVVYGACLGGKRKYYGTFKSPDEAATRQQELTRLSDKEQDEIAASHQESVRRHAENRKRLNNPPMRPRSGRNSGSRA
jgi:hypothetical protein